MISDFMHLSHNFHPINWDDDPEEEVIVAGKEGVWHFDQQDGEWAATQLTEELCWRNPRWQIAKRQTFYRDHRTNARFKIGGLHGT